MNSKILVSVAFSITLAASTGFAVASDSNSIRRTQTGQLNIAEIRQKSRNNVVELNQFGNRNIAVIRQNGQNNVSGVFQAENTTAPMFRKLVIVAGANCARSAASTRPPSRRPDASAEASSRNPGRSTS